MKVFYPNGKVIDKNPIVSYEELESGTVIMWHDKTINSLIENIPIN
jgi:hypothetical protein